MQKKYLFWGLLLGGIALVILIFAFFPVVAILIFGGFALAYLMFPLVEHFQKKNVPLQWSILLTYLLLLVVLLFLIFVVLPIFYKECLSFLSKADVYFSMISNAWHWVVTKIGSIFSLSALNGFEEKLIPLLEAKVDAFVKQGFDHLMTLPQQLTYLLLSPVLAYYFLRDHDSIGEVLLGLFPQKYRSDVLLLSENTNDVIRGFIKGNLLVSLIVGTLTGVGLFFLKVDYPLALGILAGFMDIIPYFGPILGGIPILLFAVLQPDVNIFFVLILLVFVQQFENIFVSPRIIGDCVGLHPVWIILLVFVGGSLGGLLGMVLVIPIAAVVKVLGIFFYQQYVAYRFGEK